MKKGSRDQDDGEYMRTKNKILDMPAPKKACDDVNCPFHGTLKVRGKTFTGTVISDKMQKSVLVQWEGQRFVPKYERYKKTRSKVVAHLPPCLDVSVGDLVKIAECKPISKTKNFVVLGVVGEESVRSKVKKEALKDSERSGVKVSESPKGSDDNKMTVEEKAVEDDQPVSDDSEESSGVSEDS